MLNVLLCTGLVCVNFILYLAFGSLFTRFLKKEHFSLSLSVIAGFFLYYALFTVICIPMMIKLKTLSQLTRVWAVVAAAVVLLSAALHGKRWLKAFQSAFAAIRKNPLFCIGMAALVLAQVLILVNAYNFTLDATYYVGNVATSVYTDTMNIFNPYTGAWQDHFELRYFFATYQMQDAVVCKLTGTAPLIQTKTVMSCLVILLTNTVYYKIARELFGDRLRPVFFMLLFMAFVNFNYITIYTSSNFLLTRSFEGKAIIGNVVIPGVIYFSIRLLKEHKNAVNWLMLFVMALGSTAISTTSNMLVPAALAVFILPLALLRRDFWAIPKCIACMLPSLTMMLLYVLYVKGYYVLYTFTW